MNSLKKRDLGATFAADSIGLIGAFTASAQPVTQQGLVNVNLTDITVQVPIGIAANIATPTSTRLWTALSMTRRRVMRTPPATRPWT